MNELTPEIMALIVSQLLTDSKYQGQNLQIINNVIETDNEYLSVSFDEDTEWDYKLFYSLTEPAVYLTIEHQNPQEK